MVKMISLLTQTFFKSWIISGHVHTVTHTGTVLQKDAVGKRWAGACVYVSHNGGGAYNIIMMT